VLAAYGWQDLQASLADHTQPEARAAAVETLLERLVALNAKRAAEEAAGHVRWLRPDFQQRGTGAQAGMDMSAEAEAAADSSEPAETTAPAAPAAPKRPWPSGLPEQIKAVAELLATHPGALALPDIEARFTGFLPHVLDARVVHQDVVAGGIDCVLVDTAAHRSVALRVKIQQQHATLERGQTGGQIDAGGGFPHTAFLIGNSDYFHVVCVRFNITKWR
jgi:hypothetical protein